jgi:hypothetical protein
MSSSSTIEQNNEQILNDIQALQQIEQQLFNALDTNTTLTSDQQQQIIQKMNQVSQMRIHLYQTLSSVNSFFQQNLETSQGSLQDQSLAISVVENELNESKKRLQLLETERNNKIRLVEINDYYADKYAEHSQFMKILILMFLPIILFAVLNKYAMLPDNVFYILVLIVSVIGGFFLCKRFLSMIMRDNMNYQQYKWFFNPNAAPTSSSSLPDTAIDPWLSASVPGTCIGEYCCSSGQTWDASLNQCIGTSTVTAAAT